MPAPLPVDHPAPPTPSAVVEAFLARLCASDLDGALDLCAERIEYVNVGLPAVHGRRRVRSVLGPLTRPSIGFEAYLHAIAEDGQVVLTERTDVLLFGPVRQQFWVAGRFDVVDGEIVLWRDSFDFVDVTMALLRGLVGAVLPWLRPAPPSSMSAPPGR